MTKKKFLAWGKQWHYPGLVKDGGTILKHGEAAWNQADMPLIIKAVARLKENRLLPELCIEQGKRSNVKPASKVDFIRQHQARKAREAKRNKASGIA